MHRSLVFLAVAAAAVAVGAPAGAGNPPVQVTIRHAVHGCHTWAVGSGAFAASHTLKVTRGTTLTFKNNDVMPHTLIQLAGPRVALHLPAMSHVGASTKITFTKAGTYQFRTKAGEDYPGVKAPTTGEDNVLKLVVTVP